MHSLSLFLTYTASLLIYTNALAKEPSAFLGVSIGYYDILDNEDGTNVRIEYLHNENFILEGFKPWGGT